jgi:hypothetical protein
LVEDCDWITPSSGLAIPNDDFWVGQIASSTLSVVRFPFNFFFNNFFVNLKG